MSLIETFFNYEVLWSALPALLRGFWNTLLLGIMSIVIGVPAGMVIGIIRLYAPKPVRLLMIAYIDIMRAMPVLVMLILGGVGRLYGAFIGPVVYIVVQDTLAKQYPEYWFLGIGILLIFVVLFARGGVLGIIDNVFARNKKTL